MQLRTSRLGRSGKIGMVATGASLALGFLVLAPAVFAAPAPGPTPVFELTSFTASPGASANTYNLRVTVTQTGPDGSDFGTPPNISSTEVHAFPQTMYVVLLGPSGTPKDGTETSPLKATFISSKPAIGLTYGRGEAGDVSATAHYTLTLPSQASSSDSVEIYPYSGPGPGSSGFSNQQYAFRMGPNDDASFSDDVVSGITTLGKIPVGQMPEVPYAAALPLVAVAGAGVLWLRRPKARTTR